MTATLIFDGDCGICARAAAWVRTHLRADAGIQVQAFQQIDDLASFGISREDAASAAWWIEPMVVSHRGHAAVLRALRECRAPWPLVGRALALWPLRDLTALTYGWVAQNRYRLSRGPGRCSAPTR